MICLSNVRTYVLPEFRMFQLSNGSISRDVRLDDSRLEEFQLEEFELEDF